jgi:hypothetical protein
LEGSHVCEQKLWAGQCEFYSDDRQVPYTCIDTDVDAIGISLNECACSIGQLAMSWLYHRKAWETLGMNLRESRFRNKQEGC